MTTPFKLMLYLVFFVGIVFESTAQNIRVVGKITTSNGTGIAGVHIFDSIAKVGTTSDINGVFTLDIPKKATKLRFSHIAFNTQYTSLTKQRLADTVAANTIWLDVELTQRIRELPVAEISDAKVEIAYKNSKQWILDYELSGTDEFLLLLIERNKKYLQLVNSNHEKISQIAVERSFNELFKSYLGTFHLLSKDSACQVFLIDEELRFLYHYTRHEFNHTIEPIVVSTDNHLYKKSYSQHNQVVLYNKINKESKEAVPFIENAEEMKAILFRNDYLITYGYDAFYHFILTVPPYSLLTIINDMLYFFDHLNSLIVAYDLDGNYLKKAPINYHNTKDWDKEIIVNEEKTRCFTKFTRNGETSLVEIDPNTGQTMGRYVLESHAFPTKIKIRGNEIYYLSKDYFEGEEKYFLWRQKLE